MKCKSKKYYKKSILAVSIAVSMNVSLGALAQENELEEIQVTGSRIRMTDGMAEPVPVTSMTMDELSNFEPGGTIAEQLDALPQFFSTGTAQRGGNPLFSDGGGSYLDMRGLGRNRTLVLLDGSRIVPADKRSTVNVDNIPTALLKSVDVVTGGASAAYGADALGGVTNFILDRQFEGLKLNVSTGVNEFSSDEGNWNFSVAGGTQIGEKLHVIGSFEYTKIDEIYRAAEDLDSSWFQRWGHITNPDPNGPTRITVPWVAPTSSSPSGIISGTGTSLDGMQFTDDGSGVRPFELGDVTNAGYTSGGQEATNYSNATGGPISGSGVENSSAFFGAQYELNDSVTLFGQFLLGRTESSGIAEHTSYTMAFPWYETIYAGNPFIPSDVAQTMADNNVESFRLSKVGNYLGDIEAGAGEFSKTVFDTESWSIGFDAALSNGWNLKASWQSGKSTKNGGKYPGIRVDREALARDAVIDPVSGQIVCNVQVYNPTEAELAASPGIQGRVSSRTGEPLASPIGLDNSISDCVPYNAMGAGNMTQEAWDYMHTIKVADSWVEQDFAEILLQGEVFDGWGYGPVSFATGFTYREQSFSDQALPADVDELGPPVNDPALGIRGIAGAFSGGSANLHHFSTINFISGSYDVWEWFGELNLPIWESRSGDQRLGANLAYRTSDYSSSGKVDTWKVGLDYQVIEDLRFRATKSQDVREASFSERFDTQTGGAFVDDPFTDSLNVNVTTFLGGNPNLRPEFADTTVLGFVYEPSWFEGFQISTDWYDVDISDAVDTLTVQEVVDQCYDANIFCNNLTRDSNGTLVAVSAPYLNLAQAKVEGIDLEVTYTMEPNFFGNQLESLRFRALVGHLIERSDTPLGGTPIDQVGGRERPENTGILTLDYMVGSWTFQWQQRFTDETMINTTWVEGIDVDNNKIPFYSFTNLRLNYNHENNNGRVWGVGLSINNAFDKNPPIIAGTFGRVGSQAGALNSFDEWGRRYQLSLNMEF